MLQWRATTSAYTRAAVQVLLKEANRVARELQLPERLPISFGDLVESHINSPFISDAAGLFGSVSTSNYHYSASIGNKLSSVVRNLGEDPAREAACMESLRKRYSLPKTQIDTKAARRLASGWLAAVGVDVPGLDRDCTVDVTVYELEDTFVPVYYVSWKRPYASMIPVVKPDDHSMESAASVQLLMPENRLLQMYVQKAKYITRKPLVVPDRNSLLMQTDNPDFRRMWLTTKAYESNAFRLLLEEANRVCARLGLPEKLPIESSNLTEVRIETPYIAEHLGRFGSICTVDYIYGAFSSNKLALIAKNIPDENGDLYEIKKRWLRPRSALKTNAAYTLATQWLAAASVDIKALENDCHVEIEPWSQGSSIVPLYTLKWIKGSNRHDAAVTVELLEPERALRLLDVHKPNYVKRQPLVVDRSIMK